ncbi:hypothetical protein [Leptolyngbya sp. NIES-2104]|uniref:hypothetical protein n=1 Tax=Leptolyngbya sp. NIES-2104 TaxID=1552121 RepID=UPI0006ECAB29|nr:hypothetical protein [Leptolyngbya sp. NIES-2104]GAP95084.1 hypothetical protein NIES2104_16040 [Leptolyngbya sp. NIES-2104]
MTTYKLKGKVDAKGQLVITEAIDLPPGDVEIFVLPAQQVETPQTSVNSSEYQTQAFRDLWKTAQPVADDFDADSAKWEALKEKYDL